MILLYGVKDKKGSCNYNCFDIIYLNLILFEFDFTSLFYQPVVVTTGDLHAICSLNSL